MNDITREYSMAIYCTYGHRADVPRKDCDCQSCKDSVQQNKHSVELGKI
jgi:hypothetical protein